MNKHQLLENWSPVIEQTIGKNVDASKKQLVATICQLQENYEAKMSGGQLNENNFYAVPGSVNGMGAVELPSSTGNGWTGGTKGSGDVPYSLLPLAILIWDPLLFFILFWIALDIIYNKFKKLDNNFIKNFFTYLPKILLAGYIALNPLSNEEHSQMASILKIEFGCPAAANTI